MVLAPETQHVVDKIITQITAYDFNRGEGTHHKEFRDCSDGQWYVKMKYSILQNGEVILHRFEVHESMKGGDIGRIAIKAFVSCFSDVTNIMVFATNADKIHFWSMHNFKLPADLKLPPGGLSMLTTGTKEESGTCNKCGGGY